MTNGNKLLAQACFNLFNKLRGINSRKQKVMEQSPTPSRDASQNHKTQDAGNRSVSLNDVELEVPQRQETINQQVDGAQRRLYQIPPNFKDAQQHGKASGVFNLKKAWEIVKKKTNLVDSPGSMGGPKEGQQEDLVCQCCGNPEKMKGTRYSLSCDPIELADLGSGFAMYYVFWKDVLVALLLLSLFVSSICIFVSSAQYQRSDYKADNAQSFITKITIGTMINLLRNVDINESYASDIFIACNMAGILYILLHSIFQRSKLVRMQEDLDKDKDSPSDYALLIRNVKKESITDTKSLKDKVLLALGDEYTENVKKGEEDKTSLQALVDDEYAKRQFQDESYKEQIKERFSDPVRYVNYCFDTTELNTINERIINMRVYYASFRQFTTENDDADIVAEQGMKMKEMSISEEAKSLRAEVSEGFLGLSKRQVTKYDLLKQLYDLEFFRAKLLYDLQRGVEKEDFDEKQTIGNENDQEKQIKATQKVEASQKQKDSFKGVAIIVLKTQRAQKKILSDQKSKSGNQLMRMLFNKREFERAPEPSDLFWENIGINPSTRLIRVAIAFLFTIALVVGCFFAIYGLNLVKRDLQAQEKNQKLVNPNTHDNSIRVLSFVCAFVIIFINIMLKNVVVYLTVFERHETRTAYNLSMAMKLVIGRFVNTAIVPVIVNIYSSQWFIDGGLVSDIFSIMITISFVDPIVQLLNIGGNIKKFKAWREEKKGLQSRITQSEANKLFEGPQLMMADVFANAGNLILTATFFHPLLPLSIPIAFLGFSFSYWVNKYQLLRVVERPDEMSGLIPIFFANLMPFIAFFWALSLALFYNTLYRDILQDKSQVQKRGGALWTILAFSLFFLLIPVRSIINKYIKKPYNGAGAKWYDELISHFTTDYDRENPITRTDGIKKYLTKLMEEEQDEEKKERLKKIQEMGGQVNLRVISNQAKGTQLQMKEAAEKANMRAQDARGSNLQVEVQMKRRQPNLPQQAAYQEGQSRNHTEQASWVVSEGEMNEHRPEANTPHLLITQKTSIPAIQTSMRNAKFSKDLA